MLFHNSYILRLVGIVSALSVIPSYVLADCQGVVQSDATVSLQSTGQTVSLKQDQILHGIKPCYGSKGKPTYYLAGDIGPIPVENIKLLNCHPVRHYVQGLWDSGYSLVENKTTDQSQKQMPVTQEKATPGEYLKTENLTDPEQ